MVATLVFRWKFLVALSALGGHPKVYNFDTGSWSDLLFDGDPGWPSWSHDNRFIYFQRLNKGNPEVLRFRVTGGKAETVAKLAGLRTIVWFGSWMGLTPDDVPSSCET